MSQLPTAARRSAPIMSAACCAPPPCARPSAGTPRRRSATPNSRELQDQCIRDVVAMQEEVGLKVVTDGEFRRGSYWGRFVERTDGFEIKPASFKFRNDHGHEVEFTAPYATGKIRRRSRWRSTNSCSCAT